MSELNDIRERMDRLKEDGRTPLEVGLSDLSWEQVKVEYCAETGRDPSGLKISGREVFGVPISTFPVMGSAFVVYEGGVTHLGE